MRRDLNAQTNKSLGTALTVHSQCPLEAGTMKHRSPTWAVTGVLISGSISQGGRNHNTLDLPRYLDWPPSAIS